jgi:hypothetical protein
LMIVKQGNKSTGQKWKRTTNNRPSVTTHVLYEHKHLAETEVGKARYMKYKIKL